MEFGVCNLGFSVASVPKSYMNEGELALAREDEESLASVRHRLVRFYPYQMYGKVSQVVGLVIEGKGPVSSVGDAALIYPTDGKPPINAEVVGFREGKTLLMPLGELRRGRRIKDPLEKKRCEYGCRFRSFRKSDRRPRNAHGRERRPEYRGARANLQGYR